MNKQDIVDKAYEIYQKDGQSAVFDFANKHKIGYEYCSPCETSSPSIDHDCLVCGSTTKPQIDITIIDAGDMIFCPVELKGKLVDEDLIHFDGQDWLCFESNAEAIRELI